MSEAFTLRRNVSLRDFNSFRVEARANSLVTVNAAEAIPAALAAARHDALPLLVLGEGSNVLFAADFPGVILRPHCAGLRMESEDARGALLRVGAGIVWDELVDWTLTHGLTGLENLALIPGWVGAAPVQNIGAYGVEIREFIEYVDAWNTGNGHPQRLRGPECGFGYRDSVFKRNPDRWIITAVGLRLPRQHELRLDYPGLREELSAMGITSPRAADVAVAVRHLRRRKLPDATRVGNAGSFFKNPLVSAGVAERLVERYPELPVFPADDGLRKLSAAWLIESCGWRGYREGDAGISTRHALVLVNHGKATGAELLRLARRVADSVEERFSVRLEPEPRVVGAEFRPAG
jgi:UDP-N-acetylmuramate dehydrogenase